MTGSLAALIAAALAFAGGHLTLSHPPIRNRLVAGLGEGPFRGVYSLVAAACLAWLVMAYNAAPHVEVWIAGVWARWVVLAVMACATVLLVCGLTAANPTLAGMEGLASGATVGGGIFAVTRHPVLWAFALWALAHVLARGDVAALILFGALAGLALAGMAHIDHRRRAADDATFRWLDATTSALPFAALIRGRAHFAFSAIGWWRMALAGAVFVALVALHGPVIGPSPLPW
jgi:uncharacterized membrane protein